MAEPSSGGFTLFGSGEHESQRRRLGCTIENAALYPAMTAEENMEVYRRLLGIENRKTVTELLALAGLQNTGGKKTRNFSLGMKQRLMIAISLMGDPELLVLDEPMNGLDPIGIREVRELLLRLNRERGLTIVVSSHILGELSKVCSRYGVIHSGRMVDEFSADELERRCRGKVGFYTDDPEKTAKLLNERIGVKGTVGSDGMVFIEEFLDETARINALLLQEGISVSAIVPKEQDLEEYFLTLMGGRAALT